MITSINEFKNFINENSERKFKVIKKFLAKNYHIILNRDHKFLGHIEFNVGDIITYSIQSGSLGDSIQIKNLTTGKTANFWGYEYSIPQYIKDSIELLPEEPVKEKEHFTAKNNIGIIYSDNRFVNIMYEYFSDYIMSQLMDSENHDNAYEILINDNTFTFNVFDNKIKNNDSKILWTHNISVPDANNTNEVLDIVEKDLEKQIVSINESKINESMNYERVIPRDFFNESKLLKCMAFLALKIHDRKLPENIDIKIEESGEPFDIKLDQNNGMLYVSNYPVSINDEFVFVGTTYNSKSNFPFFVEVDYTEYEIFDNDGNFTQEFIEKFTLVEA